MPPAKPSARVAVGTTLLAALLWGTSFNVNDWGLGFVGPATFVVGRFALAGAVTLAVAAAFGQLDAKLLRKPWFWGLALANASGFLMQYFGQTLTTPARTALFVNTSAFAVAFLEHFFLGARIGPRRLAAIVVGVMGAALLITGGDLASLEGGRLVGDLLVLGAGLAWSVYMVMSRRAVDAAPPLTVTAWTFALSALLLLPALLLDEAPLQTGWEGAAAIAYAGLVTTALAYGLWAYGLGRIGATASAVLLLFEILVASALSFALGRETFGAVDLLGAGMLVAAVVGMSLLAESTPGPSDG